MMLNDILCIRDLEKAGSSLLSKSVLDYFNDGSEDGAAVEANALAFGRYKIRPRVLRDVSRLDSRRPRAFGMTASFPLAVAPSGMQAMAHEDGERATARAAARGGVPMGVSTFATTSLEDVATAAAEAGGPNGRNGGDISSSSSNGNTYMLQLYVFRNRATTEALVRRAERAGYTAVLLTCDTPRLGNRYNMARNDFRMPSHLSLPNFGDADVGPVVQKVVSYEGEGKKDDNTNDDSITWETLEWLRSITDMEIWLKGITTAEDAELAARSPARVAGIIVSNHGGRQLEHAMATLDSLVECVRAVRAAHADADADTGTGAIRCGGGGGGEKESRGGRGRMQVWLDGGVRKGSDIFKALALGADGVMIGRVPLWGLALAGEEGVLKGLEILKAEFRNTMALAGCRTLADIGPSSLWAVDSKL